MTDRFAKVEMEIRAGRLWRAKEMVQGALAKPEFDPDLLEKYGQILLAMGDDLEAGRYLFASGRRRPDYRRAIDLFASRYPPKAGRAAPMMPNMLRRHIALARDVISSDDFVHGGYPPAILEQLERWKPRRKSKSTTSAWRRFSARALLVTIAAVILLSAVVGFVTILWWLSRMLGISVAYG